MENTIDHVLVKLARCVPRVQLVDCVANGDTEALCYYQGICHRGVIFECALLVGVACPVADDIIVGKECNKEEDAANLTQDKKCAAAIVPHEI